MESRIEREREKRNKHGGRGRPMRSTGEAYARRNKNGGKYRKKKRGKGERNGRDEDKERLGKRRREWSQNPVEFHATAKNRALEPSYHFQVTSDITDISRITQRWAKVEDNRGKFLGWDRSMEGRKKERKKKKEGKEGREIGVDRLTFFIGDWCDQNPIAPGKCFWKGLRNYCLMMA